MKHLYKRPMKLDHAPLPVHICIEPNTAELWLSTGTITPTWYGEENTYYINEFGIEFYCKNYPQEQWRNLYINDTPKDN